MLDSVQMYVGSLGIICREAGKLEVMCREQGKTFVYIEQVTRDPWAKDQLIKGAWIFGGFLGVLLLIVFAFTASIYSTASGLPDTLYKAPIAVVARAPAAFAKRAQRSSGHAASSP